MRNEVKGGRPERGGVRWRDMGTEIKQRQDTNQRNAMVNNTAQTKQKRKRN